MWAFQRVCGCDKIWLCGQWNVCVVVMDVWCGHFNVCVVVIWLCGQWNVCVVVMDVLCGHFNVCVVVIKYGSVGNGTCVWL